MDRRSIGIGALLCGIAVACGAFGAHALKETLSAESLAIWQTAVLYQMTHGLAILLCGFLGLRRVASVFLAGVVVFSGSLYGLAATRVGWLGAITPIGGALFLAGWAWLAWTMLAAPGNITGSHR